MSLASSKTHRTATKHLTLVTVPQPSSLLHGEGAAWARKGASLVLTVSAVLKPQGAVVAFQTVRRRLVQDLVGLGEALPRLLEF